MTGFKLTNRGEKATTEAKYTRVPTAAALPESFHRRTRCRNARDDAVGREADDLRKRVHGCRSWRHEERLSGPAPRRRRRCASNAGRPARRRAGAVRASSAKASLRATREDEALRRRLYGSPSAAAKPALDMDTTKRSAPEVALEIWETFQAEAGIEVVTNKPAMDKAAARGIFPGPATGVVTRFTAKQTPFGGYISDDRSGQEIYVHKSAVCDRIATSAGPEGRLRDRGRQFRRLQGDESGARVSISRARRPCDVIPCHDPARPSPPAACDEQATEDRRSGTACASSTRWSRPAASPRRAESSS